MVCIGLLGLLLGLGLGCGAPPGPEGGSRGLASSSPSAPPASKPASAPGGEVGSAPPRPPWASQVLLERWLEAEAQLEALPLAEREAPELRFVRARVALELGRADEALRRLEGLEASLPQLREELSRLRRRIDLAAGPDAPLLEAWSRGEKPATWSRLHAALARASDREAVGAVLHSALEQARRSADLTLEAQVRALRWLHLPEGVAKEDSGRAGVGRRGLGKEGGGARGRRAHREGAQGPTDRTWLLEHPSEVAGALGLDGLRALGEAKLSPRERMELVGGLLDRGEPQSALEELDAVARMPGVSLSRIAELRAQALRAARRHPEAAEALLGAARLNPARGGELRLQAARAFARAEQPERARELLLGLMKSARGSELQGKAALTLARLHEQQGRPQQAERVFQSALERGGALQRPSAERRDAEAGLALLLLDSVDEARLRRARALLAELGHRASPEEAPRWQELEALAAWRLERKEEAQGLWTRVAQERPLTFAAQLARARLSSLGLPLPPLWSSERAAPLVLASTGGAVPPFALTPRASLLHRLGLEREAEAALASDEATWLGEQAPRGRALCETYGLLDVAHRRYKVGVRLVDGEQLWRPPPAQDPWAWSCVYPRPYAAEVEAQEVRQGLPLGLLHAVMRQESAFDPGAASPVRAQGLLQIMPSTAALAAGELGLVTADLDLGRPWLSLTLGAFYLGKLRGLFGGSVPLAVAAYNAGPTAVSDWLQHREGEELDVWAARIPFGETRTYVAKVLGNLARYQYLRGGEAAVAPVELGLPAPSPEARKAY